MFNIHPLGCNLPFPEPAFAFFSPRSPAIRLKKKQLANPEAFREEPETDKFRVLPETDKFRF